MILASRLVIIRANTIFLKSIMGIKLWSFVLYNRLFPGIEISDIQNPKMRIQEIIPIIHLLRLLLMQCQQSITLQLFQLRLKCIETWETLIFLHFFKELQWFRSALIQKIEKKSSQKKKFLKLKILMIIGFQFKRFLNFWKRIHITLLIRSLSRSILNSILVSIRKPRWLSWKFVTDLTLGISTNILNVDWPYFFQKSSKNK